jgi:predicted MFS family arabinose efflux permease
MASTRWPAWTPGCSAPPDRERARPGSAPRRRDVPHADGLLAALGCAVDAAGFPTVNLSGPISVAGVWAVGDVVKPRAQVITAAGDGAATAMATNADLVTDDMAADPFSAATEACSPRSSLGTACTGCRSRRQPCLRLTHLVKESPHMSVDALQPAAPATAERAMTALMSACVVVVVAMVAAINLALPMLSGSSLHPSSTELLWIVDAYVLVFGCLLIPGGALGDRVGRKGVLVSGMAVFAAGSVASAAAQDVAMLVAGRVVSGMGAALVMPATLSLLLQVTPNERKPRAIATWTGATGAAGALGILGGGALLQAASWQTLFVVVAGLSLLLAVAVARVAPPGQRHAASTDTLGTLLITATVFALLLGIIESASYGWGSALVLSSLAVAALLLAAFTWHALRAEQPLLDPRLFAISKLRTGTLGVAAVFFGLFALFFVNAQYLQYAKGYQPFITGVAILPLPAGILIISPRSIAIARRVGTRVVVATGMTMIAGGLLALSFVGAATPYLPYGLALLPLSVGTALSVPSLSTGIMSSLPHARAGTGAGLNSASREIGSALGIAVVGTVLASRFGPGLPATLRPYGNSVSGALHAAGRLGGTAPAQTIDAFTSAMAVGYRVAAAVVFVSAIIVAISAANKTS